MADELKIPLSFGHAKPSSSIVNGGGMVGSWWNVGETIMFSANWGGGMVGTGVLIPLRMPTFRRRLASMMRRVSA